MIIITANPDPPQAGQPCVFCLPGGGTIRITFTPPGTATDYPVTEDAPCAEVPVPEGATAVLAHDVYGGSEDFTSPVV